MRLGARLFALAFVVTVTCVVSSAAVTSEEASAHDAAAIAARAATALGVLGPLRSTLVLRGTISSSGFKGPQQIFADLRRPRFAVYQDASYASLTFGFDGVAAWTRDTSGIVRNERFPPTRESLVNQSYIWSGALWAPTLRARFRYARSDWLGGEAVDVLKVSVPDGRPLEISVSRKDGLPVRYYQKDDMRIETLDVSDYRIVGSRVVPFSVQTDELGNRTAFQGTAAQLVEEAPSPKLRRPTSSVSDVIMGNGSSTELPFAMMHDNIIVNAYLNGKGPFRFAFTTGAENILDPLVAKELAVAVEGGALITGGANQSSIQYATIRSVQLGEARLLKQTFIVLKTEDVLGKDMAQGLHVAGLIGYEVLARFNAIIDYRRSTIVLTKERLRLNPANAVPIAFFGNLPAVRADLRAQLVWLMIGTDGTHGLVLAHPFAAAHPELPVRPQLIVGKTVIAAEPVAIDQNRHGIFGLPYLAGTLGNPSFRQRTLLLSYLDQQLEIR